MNRSALLRLMIPILLFAVSAASHGATIAPIDRAERITALNIGAPSPTLCNVNQAMSSTVRDALPGAWRNPARYGTGWDLHRDDETGLMSVTWYTFDSARRPVWYRSAVAQIDPITMTWRSSIESVRLERGTLIEPAPIGAVAIRFIQENPGKIAIRWSLDRNQTLPSDECLIDAFGETRDTERRAQRWNNPSFTDFEIVRTPLQTSDWSGERLVMLGFDSSGAPVWTVGVGGQQSPQASQISLSYYYSNYPDGAPGISCVHQGCVSAPRPAGRLTQSGPASAPAVEIAVGLTSAEVGQAVQLNRSGTLQPLVGTQAAVAYNSITFSPAGNCTLGSGVTSCQKTVAWYTSTAGAKIVRIRTDTNPVQVLVIGTASSGSQIQMLIAGRWKFEIRRNDAAQSAIVSTAEIVVGNETPGTPTNTIGFRPALECHNSSAGISPGSTPGISGRWWNAQRDSTGWDLVFTEPTAQSPNGTLIATWNTYGNNAEPVWLIAPSMQIEVASESGQTVKRAWGQLSRYTWNSATNQANATPVGEVSFTFDPVDATRASLRWKWSEAPAQSFYDECVSEYSRAAARTPDVNQAYSGSWYEPQLEGYGYSVYMASGAGTSLIETLVLNAYDNAGQPRWVIGSATSPTTVWTDLPLSYLRSNFVGGVPTSNCSGDGCRSAFSANKLSRMYNGDGATGNAKVEAYYDQNGVRLSWYRFGNPPSPVGIAKIARTDEIVVNRQLCTITTTACQVLVSWTSTRAEARAYRVNLATGTWTLLDPQSAVASRTESFSSGGRFRYILTVPETPAMQTVASSAEVVIAGQLPGTTSQISINRAECTLGTVACTVTVTWSTNVNATARVYRRRMDGAGGTYRVPVNSASGQHIDTLTEVGRYRYELKETDSESAANLALSTEILISAAAPTSTCTFSDWSSTVGTPIAGGPYDLVPVKRYRGRCAIQADAVGDYLIDNSPEDEGSYHARFYYYTGSWSGNAEIFQARGASSAIVRVFHDGANLRFSVAGSGHVRVVPVIPNRWYAIRFGWIAGAGTGSLNVNVIGAGSSTPFLPEPISGLYNSTDRIEAVWIGLISGAGSGVVGFDEFEARRYTSPALRCRGDANDNGIISSSDRTIINNEINSGGNSIALGQPDANEDGFVTSADIAEVTTMFLDGRSCDAP